MTHRASRWWSCWMIICLKLFVCPFFVLPLTFFTFCFLTFCFLTFIYSLPQSWGRKPAESPGSSSGSQGCCCSDTLTDSSWRSCPSCRRGSPGTSPTQGRLDRLLVMKGSYYYTNHYTIPRHFQPYHKAPMYSLVSELLYAYHNSNNYTVFQTIPNN